MEKTYLLLRNNIESGPYTFAQLQKQQLQPTDLIWIEGESLLWMEPSSIKQSTSTYQKEAKKGLQIPLMPALCQPSFAGSTRTEKAYSSLPEIELVIHKRHLKTVSLAQLLGVAFLTAGIAAIWSFNVRLLPVQNEVITYALPPVVFKTTPPPARAAVLPVKDSVSFQTIKPVKKPIEQKTKTVTAAKPSLQKKGVKPKDTAQAATPIVAKEEKAIVLPTEAPPEKTATDVETTEPKAKERKTIGQAIRKLFKKKNNKQLQEDKESH